MYVSTYEERCESACGAVQRGFDRVFGAQECTCCEKSIPVPRAEEQTKSSRQNHLILCPELPNFTDICPAGISSAGKSE
jgi:hypothetical protein